MPVKPFYTIGELMKLTGFARETVKAMLERHKVEITEVSSGVRPKKVVMLASLQEAMPKLFRSIMAATAANERK